MRRKSTGQNEQVPPIKQISDFGMRISDFVLGDSVCLKSRFRSISSFVLVRVTSWIVLVFLDKRKRSTKPHELNTN